MVQKVFDDSLGQLERRIERMESQMCSQPVDANELENRLSRLERLGDSRNEKRLRTGSIQEQGDPTPSPQVFPPKSLSAVSLPSLGVRQDNKRSVMHRRRHAAGDFQSEAERKGPAESLILDQRKRKSSKKSMKVVSKKRDQEHRGFLDQLKTFSSSPEVLQRLLRILGPVVVLGVVILMARFWFHT